MDQTDHFFNVWGVAVWFKRLFDVQREWLVEEESNQLKKFTCKNGKRLIRNLFKSLGANL
jgi:hypothetical protein